MVSAMKKMVHVTAMLVGQESTVSVWGAHLLALIMVSVTNNSSCVSVTMDSLVCELVCVLVQVAVL